MTERAKFNAEECAQLWKAAAAGDRASQEVLLRDHQDLIFRFCCSQLSEQSMAVEATQETALRLITSLAKFRGESRLSTWVLGIANNVCREMRRQNKKWEKVSNQDTDWCESDQAQSEQPTHRLIKQEEAGQLKEAIARLPDRQREAIVLRYFESLSVVDVAEVMRVSPGTVKASINQALKKLKLKLITEAN